MRMMLTVQMPVDAANEAIQDGRLGKIVDAALERLKPEAAYFTSVNGDRGAIFIFDLRDPSDIPTVCEPFFLELGASVDLSPVMNIDEVRAGLAKAFPS
jgi:hypothetical protein